MDSEIWTNTLKLYHHHLTDDEGGARRAAKLDSGIGDGGWHNDIFSNQEENVSKRERKKDIYFFRREMIYY